MTHFRLCNRDIPQCHPNTWKYKCLVGDGNNRYYVSCELDQMNMIIPCDTLTHKDTALVCCQPTCP